MTLTEDGKLRAVQIPVDSIFTEDKRCIIVVNHISYSLSFIPIP